MHAVGVKRELVEEHRWLAASLYKAFLQAKRLADAEFTEMTALKIGLPWLNAQMTASGYGTGLLLLNGVTENRKALSTMARYSFEQGLAVRLVAVDEMFAEGNTNETRV